MATDTQALRSGVVRVIGGSPEQFANILRGGQNGLGSRPALLDAATPLALTPLVAVVTKTPTMFDRFTGAADTLKDLVERHARTIEGVDLEYTLETTQTQSGHDGQPFETPKDGRRTPVQPQMTFNEVNGLLVWKFFTDWIRLIVNPDTQGSSLAALLGDETLDPYVASYYTMDMTLIQYDRTMLPKNIIEAYQITNMFPKTAGPAGFRRQIGESTVPDRQVTFAGIQQHGEYTRQAGKNIAELMQLHKVDFNLQTPVATTLIERMRVAGIAKEATDNLATFGAAT